MLKELKATEFRHGSLTVRGFTCNPFSTNSYVVHDGIEAVLVDASPLQVDEVDEIVSYVSSRKLSVVRALLTHGHIDHIFGCAMLADRLDSRWEIHPADMALYQHGPEQAAMFGVAFNGGPTPSATLDEVSEIAFGKQRWDVRATPGHSPGSVSFIDRTNGVAFVGDVLFRGSIGRTDLWEGSLPTLLASIERELLPLDDAVAVYSGHGPATTIGHERRFNPFLEDIAAG